MKAVNILTWPEENNREKRAITRNKKLKRTLKARHGGTPAPGWCMNIVLVGVLPRNRTSRNEIYYKEWAHVIMEAKRFHHPQTGPSKAGGVAGKAEGWRAADVDFSPGLKA